MNGFAFGSNHIAYLTARCEPVKKNRIEMKTQKPFQPQLFYILVLIGINCICYYNALGCGFVFDDISAIKENADLRPETPLSNLLHNDFWGQPMEKEHSHKSYRPLCVLTFRLNYRLHQLAPFGFHLVNVALHILVCVLYFRFCQLIMATRGAFIAAALFSVSPIHVEAVTSVVGRAETLCASFFLLALFTYANATKSSTYTDWPRFALSIGATAMATLSKEQGITAIALCAVYEVVLNQKPSVKFSKPISLLPKWIKEMAIRIALLVICAALMMAIRLKVMHSQLPVFTRFDNPATYSESPTRQLTHNYLLALNAWLLLNPMDLCCDWTMGTVPLVQSLVDARNLATVLFYLTLTGLAWKAFKCRHSQTGTVLLISLSLIVFPFLPASNLFFPVGFVLAERVLYIPSFGFCMLVAHGASVLLDFRSPGRSKDGILKAAIGLLLVSHSARTILRNEDWRTEYNIFTSGLRITEQNAKLFNNVGHVLEAEGNYSAALEYFLKAMEVQPDDLGAYVNVGRTYDNMGQSQLAERYFTEAKNLLMLQLNERREGKYARIAPTHLKVFLNLANLISQNGSRFEEAERLYREAIRLRSDYVEAYINRGEILLRLNRTADAEKVYKRALHFDDRNADIYYNLGVVAIHSGDLREAISYFHKAIDINPSHQQALLNYAIVIQDAGRIDLFPLGQRFLLQLLSLGDTSERVYFNLAMIAMASKDYPNAEMWFKETIRLRESFRSANFNLALLLTETNRPLEALPYLRRLVSHYPEHIKGLTLLGDILINFVKDFVGAKECYERILQLDSKHIQARHNLCVVYVEQGLLDKAEQCLIEATRIAPHEDYINRHLKIVRLRILKLRQQQQQQKQ